MKTIVQVIRRNKLLALVIFIYLSLLVLRPDKALLAFQNSLYYVLEMVTIMPVVLLLTALINAWVPRTAIERNLGTESGLKGAVFSFLFGSFSAGPIYAAFPVCKTLLAKGASISNIVILLSTWAVVKIPMLVNEAKFLGPKFMAARWILTTISIFIMGFTTAKLITVDDLPLNKPPKSTSAAIRILTDYCTGCGLCAQIAPAYFRLKDQKVQIIKQQIKQPDKKIVLTASKRCPANAIELT